MATKKKKSTTGKQSCEEALRALWGNNYENNLKKTQRFTADNPELHGCSVVYGNDPGFIKALYELSLKAQEVAPAKPAINISDSHFSNNAAKPSKKMSEAIIALARAAEANAAAIQAIANMAMNAGGNFTAPMLHIQNGEQQ